MPKKLTDAQLEEAQAALREGIERAKVLVHDYEQLVRSQPVEVDEPKPPNPAR
jgi:hypothetical protein